MEHDHEYLHEHHIAHLHTPQDVHTPEQAQEHEHLHEHTHPHDHDHAHEPGAHGHVHANTKAVINRLARAIGHLESVKKMVEDGRDCSEVLIQIAAVRSAINNIGKVILQDHIQPLPGNRQVHQIAPVGAVSKGAACRGSFLC